MTLGCSCAVKDRRRLSKTAGRRDSGLIGSRPTQTVDPKQGCSRVPDSRSPVSMKQEGGRPWVSIWSRSRRWSRKSAAKSRRAGDHRRRVPRAGCGRVTGCARGAQSGVQLRVLKNTLARRAVEGTPFEGCPTSWSDRWCTAFPLIRWRPPRCFPVCQGQRQARRQGRRDAQLRDGRQGRQGAGELPSRDELLAKLLATMQAPIAQFVRTLNEVPGVRPHAGRLAGAKEKAAA